MRLTQNHTTPDWTISIRPTRTGIKVHTNADVQDVLADQLGRYIEQCILKFAAAERG